MKEPRLIKCEECGAPRLTRRKNTKYCRICRLLRNFKYLKDDNTVKCICCTKVFAPLERGEDTCSDCDTIPTAGDPRGTCSFCKQTDVGLLDESVSVCMKCAKDPKNRKLLRGSLLKKRAAILNGDTEAPIPEWSEPNRNESTVKDV